MKKTSAFHEAQPRTPKAEARKREQKIMDAMSDLLDLDDEETFKRVLAEKFGIKPRQSEVPAGAGYLGRDTARADLTFLTCSTKPSTLESFSTSDNPISSICSSSRRAIFLSPSLREVRRLDSGGGTGSADMLLPFRFAIGDTLVYPRKSTLAVPTA